MSDNVWKKVEGQVTHVILSGDKFAAVSDNVFPIRPMSEVPIRDSVIDSILSSAELFTATLAAVRRTGPSDELLTILERQHDRVCALATTLANTL